MQSITVHSLIELPNAARAFLEKHPSPCVVRFDGEMGAGKTTFITAICRLLGVAEEVSSPTFGLVNEYISEKGNSIFHFDFYRLETPEEALDFGVEEYFDNQNAWCFLEWAGQIEPFLPETMVTVKIRETEAGRIIEF